MVKEDDNIFFAPETERIKKVLTKLAQGHSFFELHLPVHRSPDSISFFALSELDKQQQMEFEASPESNLFPEIGSRALVRKITEIDVSENIGLLFNVVIIDIWHYKIRELKYEL